MNNIEVLLTAERGQYLPQTFAQFTNCDLSDDDRHVLASGPNHPDYWETWDCVLDTVRLFNPTSGRHYRLHQTDNGDLLAVGVEVRVYPDNDADNPREWGNAGTMYCEHGRYQLGDEGADDPRVEVELFDLDDGEGHLYTVNEDQVCHMADMCYSHVTRAIKTQDGTEDDAADLARYFQIECDPDRVEHRMRDDVVLAVPLSLYDHSGITMSHGIASGWDCGQVGVHYMTREVFAANWPGLDPMSGEGQAKARERLEAELEVYDQYLRGDVWGFDILTLEGDHVEGCGGFFGDLDGEEGDALSAMRDHVDPALHFLLDEAAENPEFS